MAEPIRVVAPPSFYHTMAENLKPWIHPRMGRLFAADDLNPEGLQEFFFRPGVDEVCLHNSVLAAFTMANNDNHV